MQFDPDYVNFDLSQGERLLVDQSFYAKDPVTGKRNPNLTIRKFHVYEIFHLGKYWATIFVPWCKERFPTHDDILFQAIKTYPGFRKNKPQEYLITNPFPITLDEHQPTPYFGYKTNINKDALIQECINKNLIKPDDKSKKQNGQVV